MKLHLFPAGRAFGVLALKAHLRLDCEVQLVDFRRGEQRTREYGALNPNRKMPTLEDNGFVLWESNAILFYMAAQRPESGLWPTELQAQADVMRWLAWESAHWDAESCGMVSFEKASKAVLGLGKPDPAFIARGEQNFRRFAAVLDGSLKGRTWLVGDRLTIADFSVGGQVPAAEHMQLPVGEFPEIRRWYGNVMNLPAWQETLATQEAFLARWSSQKVG